MSQRDFKQSNFGKRYCRSSDNSTSASKAFAKNKPQGVTVRLDRLVVSGATFPLRCVKEIAGFDVVADFRPRQLGKISTYSRVRSFRSSNTTTLINEQYINLKPWLPRCRFTLIGDDQAGISAAEITSLIREIIGHRVTLVELAFDFPLDFSMDEKFVRRHGLFGKSHRRKMENSGLLRFGSRASTKLVRCYRKKEVAAYRVEIQANSGLLRRHAIKTVEDLTRLATLLHPTHIRFAALATKRLKKHLIRRFGSEGILIYGEAKRRSDTSLRWALRYLGSVRVTNPSRFLVPLPINDDVRRAVQRWIAKFSRQDKVTHRGNRAAQVQFRRFRRF